MIHPIIFHFVLLPVWYCFTLLKVLQPCGSPGGPAWPALSHDHNGWGWGLCCSLPLIPARCGFPSKACPELADTEGRRAVYASYSHTAIGRHPRVNVWAILDGMMYICNIVAYIWKSKQSIHLFSSLVGTLHFFSEPLIDKIAFRCWSLSETTSLPT